MNIFVASFLLALLPLTAAAQMGTPTLPAWLRAKTAAFERNPKFAEATEIRLVKFKDQDAFIFVAPCCDRFNWLYAAEGKPICAPSGGIAGRGDGKCPEAAGVESTVIWRLPPSQAK